MVSPSPNGPMTRPDPIDSYRLLTDVLKSVSRSFYLSIRILPRGMREPVAVAYLLARAADTIADTRALPPSRRLEKLLAFRSLVESGGTPQSIAEIVEELDTHSDGVSAGERRLLGQTDSLLSLLEGLPEADRERVSNVVVTLTRGMELDLTSFPPEDSGKVGALESAEQLDGYTYLVAGCAGEFWTQVAVANEPRLARWDAEEMSALGVRFGKALQLTNVLRDVPRDLRIGRCYFPAEELAASGLAPPDLLVPANADRARTVLVPWIRTALEHFGAAEAYILATPRCCTRLRLAALWPVLLGLATLERLALNDQWLAPDRPSRVGRRWVYGMMARSVVAVRSDILVRQWIHGLRHRVERALRDI